ncbi:MAG: CRISPR-associated RAMP protein Csx10 [Leptolyngbyaceae cyanobacterium]
MKRIHLTITAQAPLAIGQRKPGGSVSEAMDYIPGTVIRGTIAGRILQQANSDPGVDDDGNDDDFRKLFLGSNAAIFQNAYPAVTKLGEDQYTINDSDVCLLPATALSSKTDSGFKPKKAGVFDSLIDSFCAREHGLFYEPNSLEGDRVEPFTGFYSQSEGRYISQSISKRLLTRVGINRRRTTAQDEILYSIEVMNESQGKEHPQPSVYKGSILIEDNVLSEALYQFIERNRDRLRFGGSASRGLGKVETVAAIEDVETSVSPLQQRLKSFNQALKKRWGFWNAFGAPKPDRTQGRTFFAIDLQSDAVLTEQWRRTMVISANMLCQLTNMTGSDINLEMAYSSYDYRSGWNAAWGLPKDVELITKMGSVFLFSVPETQAEQWQAKLAALEWRGVGDRTAEGFGQIKVCDEFHLIFRETPV